MKGAIDDYFGQCPVGNGNSATEADKIISKETAIQEIGDIVVSDGKENVKAKKRMSNGKLSKGKPKTSTKKGSPQVKKVSNKKSLSTKKEKLENTAAENTKDEVAEESPVLRNFSLRIRMKSKDQEDKDYFIDDSSSPEHTESKCKELKSPKGLLKYLVSPKDSPPVGNDGSSATKSKAIRDICDYFSPSKGNNSKTISGSVAVQEKNQMDQKKSDDSKKPTANGPLEKKATSSKEEASKSRSAEMSTAKPVSSSKKSVTKDSSDKMEVVKSSNLTTKRATKVKAKSAKKSLSLTKKETVKRAVESPVCSEGASLPGSDPLEMSVVKSMNSAFQAIMSKTSFNKTDPPKTVPDMFSKKRKRENDDEMNADKPCKTVKEDSPVRAKKRYSNSNQIESDSDNEVSSTANTKTGEDNHGETVDCPLKSEESKRNSLMSYFAKVTKEEALAKEDKIEMKVQAMVHSPPTTPSKKTKRRSVNSLPGGALSLNKKKINVKAKLKENINAIDVIDVEEIKEIDAKNKDSSHLTTKKQASPSSKPTKHSFKSQTLKTPQKSSSLKTAEPSSSKEETSKSVKKSLSRGKGKQEIKTKPESNIELAKPLENAVVDEECLAVPLPAVDTAVIETPQTPSDSKTPWKMRVCLTPSHIPSTQGTMLEEESDSEEIFSLRQDKKRKLSKKSVSEKTVCRDKEVFLEDRSKSPDIVFEKETKHTAKIAPLFTRKAVSQARQQFLLSGVPDQVKRTLETQRSCEEQETVLFPTESHIQQRNNEDWSWNLPDVMLPFKADCVEDVPQISSRFSLSDITGCSDIIEELKHVLTASCKGPVMRPIFGFPLDIMKPILRLIKLGSPDFKVVNTFKVLRSKLREEEFAKAAALSAMSETEKPKRKSSNRKSTSSKQAQPMVTFRARCWTEKYKPCTASDIVGNGASIQQLKRWLESWRKASEDSSNKSSFCKEEVKRKKKRKDALDDDDDFLTSDNSSDVAQNNFPVGVAVLCGPNGSGKTSSVYALAKDLGYKVLEVNASEKRNGKLVLSKLSEATQSHQVQQGPTAEQGFAALFAKNSAKKKMPVKVSKSGNDVEEDKTKKMSLILFEDVDIVFEEEDEGFLSAISTLISTSKRPVILTTTDPESAMVQRFMNSSSVVLPFSCPTNLITVWLQIVSLLEGVYVAPATVKDLVSLCKGDFRRAILQMQLWVTSGGNNLPMPSITYGQHGCKSKKSSKKDENDDMSDMEGDSNNHDCAPSIPPNPDCISPMLGKNDICENFNKGALQVNVPFPLDTGLFWWNIPPVLSLKQLKHAELPVVKEDSSAPPLGAGFKRMLDDSFIASFCSDDASTTDSGLNEDSDAQCSQATSVGDAGDFQDTQSCCLNPSPSSVGPIPYTSACSQEEMVAVYYPLMALSFIDIIGHSSQLNISSNMEPITRFYNPVMKDSLSLTKLEVDGPNSVLNSTAQEMSHWLAEQSLNLARSCYCPENICPYSYCLPDENEYKWREAHAETEQIALQAVPLSAALERRALFTDYLPILRIFCRLERNRSCINTKRRNRFFHYLKSLGAHPNEAQLELLCRSMYGC